MLAIFVWVMAGTAIWHFAVLVPDRFYRGIIGSLVAANAGAIAAGVAASGFAVPGTTVLADAIVGFAGALAALVLSWLIGSRFDPCAKGLHRPVRSLRLPLALSRGRGFQVREAATLAL